MNRIATGCAFNLLDLFITFPFKSLKMTYKECKKVFKSEHKQRAAHSIFKECVKLVLNDVIDNNATFELPLNGKVKADIHMRKYEGDEFARLRRAGKWQGVDFLKSLFTGYQIGFFMYGNRTLRIKNIYVDKHLKEKLTNNTNEGKQYC